MSDFAAHCLAAAPDSLAKRKVFLNCLRFLLPRNNRYRAVATEMLHHLEAEKKLQEEFMFNPHSNGEDGKR